MMLSRKPILPDSTRRGVMLGDGSRKQAEGLGSTRAAGREHDEEVPGLRGNQTQSGGPETTLVTGTDSAEAFREAAVGSVPFLETVPGLPR